MKLINLILPLVALTTISNSPSLVKGQDVQNAVQCLNIKVNDPLFFAHHQSVDCLHDIFHSSEINCFCKDSVAVKEVCKEECCENSVNSCDSTCKEACQTLCQKPC